MKKRLHNVLIVALNCCFLSENFYAQGFPASPINYAVPAGGMYNSSSHNYGFNGIASIGGYELNNQGWAVMDMDGDNIPDLVVTCQGTGTFRDVFGLPSTPHWKVYLNDGNNFASSPATWALPSGGMVLSGHNYGFNAISETGSYDTGNQGWFLTDIDGDSKTDLVVTCQGTGTHRDGFGLPSSPHWKVYFNTGSGFMTTAFNYPLPAGGTLVSGHHYGFVGPFGIGSPDAGNDSWALTDMDGDMRPDLVITAEGTGTHRDVFGLPSTPHWKVHLNSGIAFGTAATWPLPAGGKVIGSHSYGFNSIADGGTSDLNNQGWSLLDLDNDLKPELVITCEGTGTHRDGLGLPSNPHWRVFANSGSGFSGTGSQWTVPTGGQLISGHNYGFNSIADAGSYDLADQGWSVADIDADGFTDLIVTCEGNGSQRDAFGLPSNHHWKVYSNAGNSFGAAITWTLPAGGMVSASSHSFGFNGTSAAGSYVNGDQGWSLMDINGDKKLDLVVVAQGNGNFRDVFGLPTNTHWKVFANLSLTVGESDQLNAASVSVYPIPATNHLIIDATPSLDGRSFRILNTLGSTVTTGILNAGSNRIDITMLSAGIYFIQAEGADPAVHRILKQ